MNPTRIIPARAGFTPVPRNRGRRKRDHPRSRGVYGCTVVHRGGAPGSSPLARGLLASRLGRVEDDGIIPARAGFTGTGFTACPIRTDHPRSRGVYAVVLTGPTGDAGSSPLARGLPYDERYVRVGTRIIPARAGFTDDVGQVVDGVVDHPRSRGVYEHDYYLGVD